MEKSSEYAKYLPYLDSNAIVSFYILFEPYKKEDSKRLVPIDYISDWQGAMLYVGNVFDVYDALWQDAVKGEKDNTNVRGSTSTLNGLNKAYSSDDVKRQSDFTRYVICSELYLSAFNVSDASFSSVGDVKSLVSLLKIIC